MYRTTAFLVWEARRRAKLAARTAATAASATTEADQGESKDGKDEHAGILAVLRSRKSTISSAGSGSSRRGAQISILESLNARYSRVDSELVSYLAWMPAHALSRETARVGVDCWQWLLAAVPTLRLNLMTEVSCNTVQAISRILQGFSKPDRVCLVVDRRARSWFVFESSILSCCSQPSYWHPTDGW